MTTLYNIKEMEETRRLLRREQTQAEEVLWGVLRGRRLENRKFRRQYSVGYFVLDFYCPEERLAVEVDGNVHDSDEAQAYDSHRTEAIKGLEINVIRCKNEEVLGDLSTVLKKIKSNFKQ
jgi:very-short-patch-repair endonuclease